ncbi:flagellar protein FlaF [Methanoculleus sp.]|uniref:flagellar protein FlaF n=1 Tax=Methanoculleus sp. TaxID=90427 RepID=UPI0025EA3477|nr:flagellar protein FlaF [Methanoculleus sp.]
MGAGSLVASAIGILLLVFTAYVLIGGTLATTEVMVEAQGNLIVHQEARMRTAIEIQNMTIDDRTLYVEVKNTGSEPIVDIPATDVFLLNEGVPAHIPYGIAGWDWENIDPDDIHPGELDPGETLNISVEFGETRPGWVQIVTPNGVTSSAYINSGE